MAAARNGIDAILRAYEPICVSRGRDYALEGRVTQLKETARGFTAVVTGEQRYRVRLGRATAKAEPVGDCSCPRYAAQGQCKHVAAVAWAIAARPTWAGTRARDELPTSLSEVYSAAKFFARLALYAKKPFKELEAYVPLGDWWWRYEGEENALLRKQLLAHVEEIDAVFVALRAFHARPLESSGGFARLYGRLADTYRERVENVRIRGPLPGPLDGRHPGFTFAYHAKRRVFEIRERSSPLLKAPLHLGLELPLGEPDRDLRFEDKALSTYETDAWEIFALRAMLEAMHARVDPAVQELAHDFDRPGWQRVLEHLSLEEVAPAQPREWTFCLESANGRPREYALSAFARASGGARGSKWKRQKFEALLNEPVALPIEQEIARCALFAPERGQNREAARFTLGTAHGHELLRLLARHPRVLVARPWRQPDPEADPPVRITAGLVTMSIGARRHGMFRPEFRVDGEPLQLRVGTIPGERSALFRHMESNGHIVSLEIPSALRPWFNTAAHLGRGLAFPSEAVSKLASATQPLVAAGLVELPRAALGEELPYQPEPALRVEWKTEGNDVHAVLEVMIRPHPSAPFVATGSGARTFTFEAEGKRAFVERDMRRELQIAGATVDAIDSPLLWDSGVGRTDTLHDVIELARWLERNPLGLPIEVKVGRAPAVHEMTQKGNLVARKIGAWLRIDGSFNVAGHKVTLGEMLEAARHAQRYLRVGSGVFLELSNAAMTKLKTLAIATTLAKPGPEMEGAAALHHGFGALLAQVSELFENVETTGFDLREYAERFERTRGARIRVPALENGKLRDYQREGVAWMLRLAGWAPGCVLADDMGLGKTVQTAAVLKARAKLGPALVVAPASVSSNWVAELARFMPSLRVRWFNEQRAAGLGDLGAGDVLVVSYGLLLRESAAFREVHWSTVVVDEAQYVKNIEARRSDAVRNLRRDFTIALTGTPLENHLGELFSIVDIAFPGLLGDEASFRGGRSCSGAHARACSRSCRHARRSRSTSSSVSRSDADTSHFATRSRSRSRSGRRGPRHSSTSRSSRR
ncbi:MAG: SNF2/helicase domain protein [Labilithrix sp.]|nr:SNF2/helicase domain protein [Labilithrix sp.]